MKLSILFLIAFFLILSFQSRVTSSQEDAPETQADSFAAHLNQNRDKYKRKQKKVVTTKRSAITVSLSAKQKEEQKKKMTSTTKSISTTRKVTTTQKTTTKTTTAKPKVITWPPVKETLSSDVIKALDFSLNLLVWEDRKIERFTTPEVAKLGAPTMLRCLSDGQRKDMNRKMVDCQKQYKNHPHHYDNNAKEVEITDCFVHSFVKTITSVDKKGHHTSVLDKALVKKEIDNTHVMDKNGVKQHFESCLNQYMKATRLNEFIDKKIPQIRQNANWDVIDKLFNNKTIEGKKDLFDEAREDVFSQKGMACFLESLVKHGCVDEASRKSTNKKP